MYSNVILTHAQSDHEQKHYDEGMLLTYHFNKIFQEVVVVKGTFYTKGVSLKILQHFEDTL